MSLLSILLEITVYSALIFCFIMLFKKLFGKHISPSLHYCIWLLLVLRLIMPVTIDSGFSLFTIPAESVPVSENVQAPAADTVNTDIYAPDESISETSNNTIADFSRQSNGIPQPSVSAESAATKPFNWSALLLYVWISGAALSILYLVWSYLYLKKRIGKSAVSPNAALSDIFHQCVRELGIKRNIRMVLQDEISSPALLVFPVMLIPADIMQTMDKQQIAFAIKHELMHYKRRDNIACLLLSMLQAVYWFNPFVWLAYRQIRMDMETACDSMVVKTMDGDERLKYAATVLSLFSRKRQLPVMLGMAVVNTKKTAEKRLKGIYMKQKSNRKGRLAAAMLACVMLITCFTTACQPTPEEEVVVGKDSGVSPNNVYYKKSDFPITYENSYSDSGVDIVFNASVKLPESEIMPTYRISQNTFSQDQVDSVIKALFGDTQMYAPAAVTKSELEPAYLQALADLKNKQEHPDQYENTVEYYQQQVNELKQRIDDAPKTDTLKPVDSKLKKSSEQGIEYWSGRGDLGKDPMATLSITNSTNSSFLGNNSYFEFKNGSAYVDMSTLIPVMQDNGPVKLNITENEAIQEADDVVRRLGADNMEYAACTTGIMLSTDGHYTSDYDPQRPQAYLIYYKRNVSGVPVTYDLRSFSNDFAEDSYTASTMYERIMVAVDDTGVTYIRWQGPISIDGVSVENNKIIPFEDMMILAKNQLSYSYAAYDENQQQPSGPAQAQPLNEIENGRVVCNEVHIQRITLGFMQLPVKDKDKHELVPVWDFFGCYETVYENGARVMHYQNDKSLLTINALDGSVIDRDLGY